MRTTPRTTILLGVFGLLLVPFGCSGSGDKNDIRAVAADFFLAMETRDVELASSTVISEGSFVSVRPGFEGRDVRSFTNSDWLERLDEQEREIKERFLGSPFIIVEKDVAVLFGDYEFEIDGSVSHTGIDIFNFVRTDEGWKIAGGVYSVEPSGQAPMVTCPSWVFDPIGHHVGERMVYRMCIGSVILSLVASLFLAGCAAGESGPSIQLVREHFARFNAHDAPGLGALSSEDVAWYTISGDSITPNAQGNEAVIDGLTQYFEALPSVRAELEHVHAAGSYVIARERVAWTGPDGGERSQAAYSVYEIREGEISNVWYFEAEVSGIDSIWCVAGLESAMGSASLKAHVALLRGINVGGKNKVPMVDLREAFEKAGCEDVRTYIQSGNVVFSASASVERRIGEVIERELSERLGVRSPVITRSAEQMLAAFKNNPFNEDEKSLSVGFCADKISPKAAAGLDPDRSAVDSFRVLGREIYLHLPNGVARTKLTNAWFDAQLGTTTTFRNWRTVGKLVEMSGG